VSHPLPQPYATSFVRDPLATPESSLCTRPRARDNWGANKSRCVASPIFYIPSLCRFNATNCATSQSFNSHFCVTLTRRLLNRFLYEFLLPFLRSLYDFADGICYAGGLWANESGFGPDSFCFPKDLV
jgi:hypothetical protein